MARRAQEFQTIRSEGGLLPPDLLRRVIDSRGSLKGTKPEDYGLPQGERLNEVITQSWNRLRRHWSEFRTATAKLPEEEAGTGITNDKWSLPLLRELGFGLLPTSASPEISGRTYAISRFFGSVPIHLVGCGLSLDRRAAGVRGAAGGNPHGLVQEVLNRSPDHWGIVGNGLRLRILRDNQALSRQSFLEFDLESMFSAEAYSDFVLLWLVGHATRFAPRDGNRVDSCWLEEWTKEAQEQGTRALKYLRGSVERALQVLGQGFTSHPKNTAVREALRSGSLPLADFHGQLLRVVYRLIFLFVAEDRTLEGQAILHLCDDAEATRVARERYATHYSTVRLRDLAGKIKGSRHGDLWRQFQILVGALSGEAAFEATRRSLALPALGSFLWSPGSTTALNDAELTNHDLLEALRHLAFTRQGKVLRPVDYRNLGAEELGGIYESLLALTPQVSADGAQFTFAEFSGNERKTSGSYYTPDALVQCLLDSALDPVVEEAVKGKIGADAEKAILGLKVCDPAVGSGHFLVGAAHRLARHLSRVRAHAQGESEPSPLLYQHALRDVIGRCLYGVDLNPMAAELCRVGLWLEALEPGKPLSFLDHHIRVGNSLLGATPELIADGLPDNAFDPIEGDDKKVCSALKKRNRLEREGQRDMLHLMVAESPAAYSTLADRSRGIDEVSDATLDEIKRKAEQFQRLVVSEEYRHAQRVSDAWCATFVWPKRSGMPVDPPTSDVLHRLRDDGNALTEPQVREVGYLAAQYHFFHWQLAFPEVFVQGGFDCILGNPPWGQIQFEPEEFFAFSAPHIAKAANMASRERLIDELPSSAPELYAQYVSVRRELFGMQQFCHASNRFPLTSPGRLNTAPLFCELSRRLLNQAGRLGMIVPTGIATDSFTQAFIREVIDTRSLISLFDFENKMGHFEEVHSEQRFCLFTCGRGLKASSSSAEFVFVAHAVEDLRDAERRFILSAEDIALLNPNTRTCPIFRSRRDAELAKALYRRVPVLVHEAPDNGSQNLWGIKFKLMFMMNTASSLFRTREQLETAGFRLCGNVFSNSSEKYLPLFEGKLTGLFDHRAGTFDGVSPADLGNGNEREATQDEKSDASFSTCPRYWVRDNDVVKSYGAPIKHFWQTFHDIANPNNERTFISTVIPGVAVGNTLPICLFDPPVPAELELAMASNWNSFVLDFVARLKISSRHFNFFIAKQLPMLGPGMYGVSEPWVGEQHTVGSWLLPRALELTYMAWDLQSLAQDCGWSGPPFRWDEERRFLLRCELDAAFFHLYLPADAQGDWKPARKSEGCPYEETSEQVAELKRHFPTPRDAVAYIMDTFPIVRRKDEETYAGDYRTKRVIFEIYDAMREAIRTGRPYQTRLDPLPGPPRDAAGHFVHYAQIARDPPPHIHLPRGTDGAGSVALQLSDLATRFPSAPFLLRLGTGGDAQTLRVRPVSTADIQAADRVVLASPKLRSSGTPITAALGRLRVEARTDAGNDSAYVLVTVRGEGGTAQARFSEEEWGCLTNVGVVEEAGGA